MITTLEKEYKEFIAGNKKSNMFHEVIKNNQELKEELYSLSEDLALYYENPSDIQRLSFIFREMEIKKCSCGDPRSWRSLTKGYNKTCGKNDCKSKQNMQSVKEFYQKTLGVDHLFQTSKFKERFKETSISKYGVDNPSKSQIVIDKGKQTNLEKFGETSWLKVKENQEYISNKLKDKNTILRDQNILKNNIPITILEFNNGSDVKIVCNICKVETRFSNSFMNKKISYGENPCLNCNPPLYSTSKGEIEFKEFIRSIYNGEILENDRIIGNGKEIDILLPNEKLGYEFNGIYWHSEIFKDKKYHIDKKNIIESKGIKLHNIWEDDWLYKNEIIKSRIINSLGGSNRIHARKCRIEEILPSLERSFLNENHIQGYVSSKIKIGLFYENKLVALMSFGLRRGALGSLPKINEYEMLRFCNKLNTSIVGGASKILNHFLKKYLPDKIISYQDNSWSAGNLYK